MLHKLNFAFFAKQQKYLWWLVSFSVFKVSESSEIPKLIWQRLHYFLSWNLPCSCEAKVQPQVEITSLQISLGSQGFWTPDELHGAILYFSSSCSLHFKSSLQILQVFSRMLRCCFTVKLQKRRDFTWLYIKHGGRRWWLDFTFVGGTAPLNLKKRLWHLINHTHYLYLFTM